jgi:tetratricopeptide (TPR) repeat protein
MLRIALESLPVAGDIAQLHGMLAFGYEQSHLMREAEASAHRALDIYPSEPWAQHALAHVYLTEGRIAEGIHFLESRAADWDGLTSFMYTHNWWHLAVFYLSEGRFDGALSIYDQHVWARDRLYSQDQVGAVSLLARLELAGQDVGKRWEFLGDYLVERRGDLIEPFLTLQYLYGLARAKRTEARFLLDAIVQRAGHLSTPAETVWSDVAAPIARGLVAHADGDHRACVRWLGPALGRLLEVGGSHAQRDLFAQIHLDSLIKSGADSAAQQLLEQRRAFEPNGVPLNRLLSGVYERLGLPEQAKAAADRACRTPPPQVG